MARRAPVLTLRTMSKKRREQRKRGSSRSVGYAFHVPDGTGYSVRDVFDETAMEKLLGAAKVAGLIHQFDTGRGANVWFYGIPGPALRELRDKVLAMMPATATSLETPEQREELRQWAASRWPPGPEAVKILQATGGKRT